MNKNPGIELELEERLGRYGFELKYAKRWASLEILSQMLDDLEHGHPAGSLIVHVSMPPLWEGPEQFGRWQQAVRALGVEPPDLSPFFSTENL